MVEVDEGEVRSTLGEGSKVWRRVERMRCNNSQVDKMPCCYDSPVSGRNRR